MNLNDTKKKLTLQLPEIINVCGSYDHTDIL